VLVPDPADGVAGIILVFGEPKLAFLTDDIENLKDRRSVTD
jgi:hypothetical protein